LDEDTVIYHYTAACPTTALCTYASYLLPVNIDGANFFFHDVGYYIITVLGLFPFNTGTTNQCVPKLYTLIRTEFFTYYVPRTHTCTACQRELRIMWLCSKP